MNPLFNGEADPVITSAFYALLDAALTRSRNPTETTGRALDEACAVYAASLTRAAKEMIARKAAERNL